MKKIMFLHGLESKQGGSKVEYLEQFFEVHAPECRYHTKPGIFYNLLDQAEGFKPDFIVGSSMGGYMAYLIGQHLNCPVILFNPALHSRSIEPIVEKGIHTPDIHLGLGMRDDVIDPMKTLDLLGYEDVMSVYIENHKHQTPQGFFEKTIKNVVDQYDPNYFIL
jgi:esterase/lipase